MYELVTAMRQPDKNIPQSGGPTQRSAIRCLGKRRGVDVSWARWIGASILETTNLPAIRALRPAWNKGRIVGQKRPLKPKHVWAIRVRLELAETHRDLALFNLAIDSKLRGCDLVKMKVVDVMASGQIKERASGQQSKMDSTVRYLGVELEDALVLAEAIEI